MNILFFVTEFPTFSETFIINQIVDLKKKGHLVHIYSHYKPSVKLIHAKVLEAGLINDTFYPYIIPKKRLSRFLMRFRLVFTTIPNTNFFLILKSFFNNSSTISIYNFYSFQNKPKYEIVHSHFGVNGNLVTELQKLGLFRKSKFVTTFHGFDLAKAYKQNGFYDKLFVHCYQFTVNTKYSKQRLMDLGCPEERIEILPVGLDIKEFKKKDCSKEEGKFQMLFVGRLVAFKAADRVLKICQLLKSNQRLDFKLIIVGDGPLREQIERLIFEYDLSNYVNLIGFATQEDIIYLMNQSHIFLYPGITVDDRAENQGLVIQEAQAMQLPVIISDAGGMKEGIIDNVSGFVIKENQLNVFVEKIKLLQRDPNLRKKMGEEGRKWVMANYDIEKLNERLTQIYSR